MNLFGMKNNKAEPLEIGTSGGLMTQQRWPTYLDATLQNRVFVFSQAAAGVVANAPGAGADTVFAIANPVGSGRILVPLRLTIGYVDTTWAAGFIGVYYQKKTGAQAATGAKIVSGTEGTALSMLVGAVADSKMLFYPAVENLTSASDLLFTLGLNSAAGTAADTRGLETWKYDFDGTLAVLPDSLIEIAGNAAVAAKIVIGLIAMEVDAAGLI